MFPFPRFTFSIAQLLVFHAGFGSVCALAECQSGRIYFPSTSGTFQISADGGTLAVALTEPGRQCVLVCDAGSGACRCFAEFRDGEPNEMLLSKDCGTWAALFDGPRVEFGRTATGDRWGAAFRGLCGSISGPRYEDVWPEAMHASLSGDGGTCAVSRAAHRRHGGCHGPGVLPIDMPSLVTSVCFDGDGRRLAAACACVPPWGESTAWGRGLAGRGRDCGLGSPHRCDCRGPPHQRGRGPNGLGGRRHGRFERPIFFGTCALSREHTERGRAKPAWRLCRGMGLGSLRLLAVSSHGSALAACDISSTRVAVFDRRTLARRSPPCVRKSLEWAPIYSGAGAVTDDGASVAVVALRRLLSGAPPDLRP